MLVLAVAILAALYRPQLQAQTVRSELREAMAIVAVVYPELVGRPQHVVLTGEREVRVNVGEIESLGRGGARRSQLAVDLRFDARGRLLHLQAVGAFVNTPANSDLRERVRALAPGQESSLRPWLRERGGRFGPEQAPVFERSPQDMLRLTGLSMQVQPGGFRWRNPATGEADPGWVVLLSGTDATGLPSTFSALLEPVSGRVVRLARQER